MPVLDKTVLLLSHQEHSERHGPDTVAEEVLLANFLMGHRLASASWLGPCCHSSAFCLSPFHRPLRTAGNVTKAGEGGLHPSHISALALEKEEAGV